MGQDPPAHSLTLRLRAHPTPAPPRCEQNPKVTADRAYNAHGTNFEGSPEPIYGNLFLPRKFKIAVTGGWPL